MPPSWVIPAAAQPMLAAVGSAEDLASPGRRYELKWDGMRVIAGVHGREWRLRTRNALEAQQRFPELVEIVGAAACPRLILDGEIVCLDEQAKPSFQRLQQRIQAAGGAAVRALADRYPSRLVLFDILQEGDEWLTSRPWEERRKRLESAILPSRSIELSPVWESGEDLWQAVCRLGMEGVMAKSADGLYLPGRRSPSWRKIKRVETLDVVVGGWTEGAGQRSDSMGALMVGMPSPGGLQFMGHVGTGLDPPFVPTPVPNAPAHWVEPCFVCEVRHHGQTTAGSLRAPVFVRWRPDLSPTDL
ncbi:MAG: DNA ligase [Chloroflexi bacterium]|nr:DNA ligase [Chloroflexota bacterium]